MLSGDRAERNLLANHLTAIRLETAQAAAYSDAGKAAAVDVSARSGRGLGRLGDPRGTIRAVRRAVPAAVAVLFISALVGAWLSTRSSRKPNILIVSIDTLRADRVGSYGYAAAQTPILDALAARGLRFAQATTVAPLTLPAHASLFTGTFPTFHGVRDNGQFYVGDEQTTLAEVLKGQGYRTGGFVGAFVLDRRWGIAQGFDTYFDNFDLVEVRARGGDRRGAAAGRTRSWIRRRRGCARSREQPFFAWVHLYDPHSPYAAPEAYASRFPRTMHGAYDAEMAFADAQLGRLLDRARRRAHADDRRRHGRSRRVARRAPGAAARVLRLRRDDAGAADHDRAGHPATRLGRSGPHRRRHADGARSRRRGRFPRRCRDRA